MAPLALAASPDAGLSHPSGKEFAVGMKPCSGLPGPARADRAAGQGPPRRTR
jgi:hypothetical protein